MLCFLLDFFCYCMFLAEIALHLCNGKHTGCSPNTYLCRLDLHSQKTLGFPKSYKNRPFYYYYYYLNSVTFPFFASSFTACLPSRQSVCSFPLLQSPFSLTWPNRDPNYSSSQLRTSSVSRYFFFHSLIITTLLGLCMTLDPCNMIL